MKLYYAPRLTKYAQNLRKAGNLSEVLLWKELKSNKLGVRFLRQRPIGKYIVDFFCHKLKLVVEIDGISHDAKVESDIRRQAFLEAQGITLLRFFDADVRNNLSGVLLSIAEHVKSSAESFKARTSAPPLAKEE